MRRILSVPGFFLLAAITGMIIIGLGSRGSFAQTDCPNFWINPQTGAEECLDRLSQPVPAAPGSNNSGSGSSSPTSGGNGATPASPSGSGGTSNFGIGGGLAPVSKEVLAQLQTKGSTRVIVILKSDPVVKQRLEGQLDSASARGAAEVSIAALVNPVATSLNLNVANSGLIKFTTVPAFAANLNRDQINHLSNQCH